MRTDRRAYEPAPQTTTRSLARGRSATLRKLNISDSSRLLTVMGGFCGDVADEV